MTTRSPGSALESNTSVSSMSWPAFQCALARTQAVVAGSAAAEVAASFLPALHDAVQRRVAGGAPADSVPASPAAQTLVAIVRRAFIELVGSKLTDDDASRDATEIARILVALGEIECTLDHATPHRIDESLARRAFAPLVEVAHDIRSPLTAILFLVEMLRSGRSGGVNAVQARQLNLVYNAALGLNHLACDLIDFIRGADCLMESEPVPFSIREVLHGVSDIIYPMTEEKGIEIVIVTAENDARLGAPSVLSRIMLNLATNAAKFTSEGSIKLAAEELGGDRVELSVTDSGSGIPSHVLDELFQPSRSCPKFGISSFSSTGLGLSICHRLVTALRSELHIDTMTGLGTRCWFALDLPFAAAG